MNIGIVTTWFERGAAYVSRAYMDVLSTQHNVYIYARGGEECSAGDPNWDLPNVTYGETYKPLDKKYQLFTSYNKNYINMSHFERWLSEKDISTIIFNEERDFTLLKRTKNMGYIIGAYIDYYTRNTVKEFEIYNFLLCNTKRHHSVFKNFPNSHYFPWGTDIQLFKPARKNSISKTVTFFHSAGYGGVNNRKGTDLLIRAFQKVTGNCKLIIHSQVPAFEYGNKVHQLITKDSRINFIEKTVTAPGLYHLGDVFVYPTRLEGIGLCIPEALACGLAVITTDNAPMNEFVKNNENGFLTLVKETRTRDDGYYWPESIVDIEDLSQNMQSYVDNRTLLQSHQNKARRLAKKQLDWTKNTINLGRTIAGFSQQFKHRSPLPQDRVLWYLEKSYVAFLTLVRKLAHLTFSNKAKTE